MTNKTAMQQMLEWTRKTFPMDLDTPRMIENKIESLLKVEKKQIMNAYMDAYGNKEEPENYYNQTYVKITPNPFA